MMRLIILLLFTFLFSGIAISQKPTRQQIEAQKKEALDDAKQQVADLKKQIAEAKANNEDPESIKDMEKQLATMEQMITMLTKSFSPTKPNPETFEPPKTVEPKYVSPFEPIVLKQTVAPPNKDQAIDQLFWYKGKKIDANTLITIDKTIVRYNRSNNRLIIQTDQPVDTPYYGLLKLLSQTTQIRNDFVIGLNSRLNSFFMYPEIQKAYDDFIVFRDRYYDIGRNVIDLPDTHESLEALHQQLLIKMSTLPSPHNVPLPPERPNDLCDCNSNERKQYEIKLSQWFETFCHDENGLLYLLEAIYLDINSGGVQGYNSLVNVANLRADIVKAFDLALERLTLKLQDLTNKYQPSAVSIEDGLVLVTMYLQKLNFQTFADAEEQTTKNLKRAAHTAAEQVKALVLNNTVFEKYVEDQKAALNFNSVFEYRLYESHEMNKKALSRSNNVQANISAWLDKLDKFNRFALSMKLDFDYLVNNGDELFMEATGQLQSDYVIVSLGKDDCGWHLSLKDPDYTDRSGREEPFQIPFTVRSGSKFIKDVGNFNYTGPGKMNMIYPLFKIDLCPNTPNDRVYLEGLRYSDANIAAFPNQDFSKVYTTDMFQYVNKMFVMLSKVKDNSSNIMSSAVLMMNIGNINTRPPSTGNKTLDKFMMDYLMYKKKGEMLQNVTQTTHTANTVVLFDAQNGKSTIISQMKSLVDAADEDQSYGIKMKTANFTIEVRHSPL